MEGSIPALRRLHSENPEKLFLAYLPNFMSQRLADVHETFDLLVLESHANCDGAGEDAWNNPEAYYHSYANGIEKYEMEGNI